MSEVKTWHMTPEQLEEYRRKYPPKMPLSEAKKVKNWRRLTKHQYLSHRESGLSDHQICSTYPGLTMQQLQQSIKRWGVE